MNEKFQHTKIIFTIGPTTSDESTLKKLIKLNANICRINMAHASHDWVSQIINTTRKISKKFNKSIAHMIDIKGPEVRTGFLDNPIQLKENSLFDFIVNEKKIKNRNILIQSVAINYSNIDKDLAVGSIILVDNGLLHFELLEKRLGYLRCRVLISGVLKSYRHINLPGTIVKIPSITNKDEEDIKLGVKLKIEFFALSFVREANDVVKLRKKLQFYNSKAKIIAKIEDQSAIKNLDSIITASDGIMIARGDLGIECPYEELPIIQKKAIRKSILFNKPVIVATHMLESMINFPVPTRAEVSDVANAVLEQADAIMLSGETATGKYPVQCVQTMNKIALKMELIGEMQCIPLNKLKHPKEKIIRSAIVLAKDLKLSNILIFTSSGHLAQILSSMRPNGIAIYAFTNNLLLYKQLLLLWGVKPFYLEFYQNSETTISKAIKLLKEEKYIKSKDWQVIITNILTSQDIVDSIQLRKIE